MKWGPPRWTEFSRRWGGERGKKGRIRGRRMPTSQGWAVSPLCAGGWEVEVGGLFWRGLEGIGRRHAGH